MSLLLSISTNQIVTSSNRAGSISLFSWSRFKTADARVLFDVARKRKVLAWRNWQMVGMIFQFNQPQPWLLTANVKETTVKSIGNARSMQIQSVRVSADFYGKYKCDDEVKYNICSVFNDISHFRCFVTTHKLKF